MSGVNNKRAKFRQQIRQQEKQNYIKSMRQALMNTKQSMEEETPDAVALRQFIHRSLVENQMLAELRQRSLLQKLAELLKRTKSGRQITLVLTLLANILEDDVNLDEKEAIAKLCIIAYESQVLRTYVVDKQHVLLGQLNSMAHNIRSLSKVLAFVDEDLAVRCEKIIIKKVVEIVDEVVEVTISNNQIEEEKRFLIDQSFMKINGVLSRFLYCESEYRGEIRTRFDRNTAYFIQLLKIHFKIFPLLESKPSLKILHEGLLSVSQILSEEINMVDYTLYFQTQQYIGICLFQIFSDRDQNWSRMALDIVTNMLIQYKEPHIYSIVQLIDHAIDSLGGGEFFKRFMIADELSFLRMYALHAWRCQQVTFKYFQMFFSDNWRDLIDFFCQIIRKDRNHDEVNISLKNLIVFYSVVENKEKHAFGNYFCSIGGQAMLEEVSGRSLEGERSQISSEDVGDMCYTLMDLLRRNE